MYVGDGSSDVGSSDLAAGVGGGAGHGGGADREGAAARGAADQIGDAAIIGGEVGGASCREGAAAGVGGQREDGRKGDGRLLVVGHGHGEAARERVAAA